MAAVALMYVATTLLYPCALAALCLGAGLLVDRLSRGSVPSALLLAVGAATLIGLSQISTYFAWLAPATPYLMAAFAAAGLVCSPPRLKALVRAVGSAPWLLAVSVLAYVIALAPVLLSGRATFTSYMALADSAVHMMGADFLIRHGQDYSHIDLRNSYGQFVERYYNSNYPSGADTLLGGSALLVRLPVIWVFQPFNAFMLATATGPAWLLARRMGLTAGWASLAALSSTSAALVYGYELVGSIKEMVAMVMILTLGCLAASARRWLAERPAGGAVIVALVAGAGVSALGVAFGVWALVAAAVIAAALAGQWSAWRRRLPRLAVLAAAGLTILVVACWPTWVHLSGSLQVAQSIASTSNPGNLRLPLRAIQIFGVWLHGSYKQQPLGIELAITYALIVVTFIAALLGGLQLLRRGAYALTGWLALALLAWLVVDRSVTTWGSAKALVLTSPLVVLLAWGGVAALRAVRARAAASVAAPLLAFALIGGVLASDALQYHSANLAPTARYEELASVNARFAGRGPALFTDFDEYALYGLRDLDVGGPNFVYPPPALATAGGYAHAVDLPKLASAGLGSYPLIVTRRDPSAARPPSPYALRWQGTYYQVWQRVGAARTVLASTSLSGPRREQCSQIARFVATLGRRAMRRRRLNLTAAPAADLVTVALASTRRPRRWVLARPGIVMNGQGTLRVHFQLRHSGRWQLWLKGDVMRPLTVAADGRPLGAIGAQLGGNSLVANTLTPLDVELSAGSHTLTLSRPGASLAPGDGGAATLAAIFLAPAGRPREGLMRLGLLDWRKLCSGRYQWVEATS